MRLHLIFCKDISVETLISKIVQFPLSIVFIFMICINLSCGQNPEDKKGIIGIPPEPDDAVYDLLASWSGVNNLIAYVHWQKDENDPDLPGIYLINPNGMGKRFFHEGGYIIMGLDWSPDGRCLLLYTEDGLFKISYPDKAIDTLMGPGQYYSASWSPDGTNITSVKRTGDNRGVYMSKDNGSGYHLIIPYGDYPSWLYRDSLLYMNYSYQFPSGSLCLSDTNGSRKRLYLDNRLYDARLIENAKIHFETHRIVCEPYIPGEQKSIWVFNPDDSTFEKLFERAQYANFGPDGSTLVFTIYGQLFGNLWIINWDGSELRQLTE